MSKGKKFNAAKKHFQEKEIKLKREMHKYEEVMKEAINKAELLQQENDKLKEENNILRESNKILMELKNLDEEDIKLLLEKSQHIKNLNAIMNIMNFNKY